MNGKFIVIDGPDGSGKATQTKKLVERLQNEGVTAEYLTFPRYGNPSAYFVERYLNGAYGSLNQVNAKRSSLFFALDRFDASTGIRELLAGGTTIVSDRYVSGNKGMQMAKISDPTERRAFLDWLNELEYDILGIPKPDMTVLLHVPAQTAYDLIAKKDERGYLNGKKRDIHEANLGYLQDAERAYLELPQMDTVERWKIIPCTENGQLLSIDAIHQKLYDLVRPVLS